ncbi:MAG: hypothetical protein ACKOK8_08575, partial [Planctomycetia bacterium]
MNATYSFTVAVRRLLAVVALVAWLTAAGNASAAVFTWDGGGGNNNWNTPANWVGDTAPVPATTNDLIFSGTTKTGPAVSVTTPYVLNSLSFAAGSGSFSIGGVTNSRIQLGSITNSSSVLQTIGSTLGNPIVEFTTGGTVDTGTAGLLIQGALQGAGSITKTGAGQLGISNLLSNSYSGTINATSGTLLVGANLSSANVEIGSSATLNTSLSGAAVNNLTVDGTLQPGTAATFGGLNVGGNLTLGNTATSAFAVNDAFFDSVAVTGTTTFNGALVIDMQFIPAANAFNIDLNQASSWSLFSVNPGLVTGDLDSVKMTGLFGP